MPFLFFFHDSVTSSVITLAGHSFTHFPHPTHRSPRISAQMPRGTEIAFLGQTLTQHPQATHSRVLTTAFLFVMITLLFGGLMLQDTVIRRLSVRILIVRTETGFAPFYHHLQDRDKAFPQCGQRVFYFGRDFPVYFSVQETVAFQFPELLCQCGLCDAFQTAHQFPETLDFIKSDIP